jgi:hypothetical protein
LGGDGIERGQGAALGGGMAGAARLRVVFHRGSYSRRKEIRNPFQCGIGGAVGAVARDPQATPGWYVKVESAGMMPAPAGKK